jgi:hypothetical protein
LRQRDRHHARYRLAYSAVIAAIAVSVVAAGPASAEVQEIAARQRAEKKFFSDAEIIEGFLKTALGAEYHLAGRVDRIRKYVMPVRVFADGGSKRRRAQLAKIVADIGARVEHLDIVMAGKGGTPTSWSSWCATTTSTLPSPPTMATRGRARSRPRSIRNASRASERTQATRSSAPTSSSRQTMATLYFSTLGPISDTISVPWTMFNDQVSMGFFDVFDQYILNLLYGPHIKAGMTIEEVKAVLPEALTEVRAWVKKVNNLPD